jgi:hypothetical protein
MTICTALPQTPQHMSGLLMGRLLGVSSGELKIEKVQDRSIEPINRGSEGIAWCCLEMMDCLGFVFGVFDGGGITNDLCNY